MTKIKELFIRETLTPDYGGYETLYRNRPARFFAVDAQERFSVDDFEFYHGVFVARDEFACSLFGMFNDMKGLPKEEKIVYSSNSLLVKESVKAFLFFKDSCRESINMTDGAEIKNYLKENYINAFKITQIGFFTQEDKNNVYCG